MIYFNNEEVDYIRSISFSFAKSLSFLSDEERLKMLLAIFDYLLFGECPNEETGIYVVIFELIKPCLDILRVLFGEEEDE